MVWHLATLQSLTLQNFQSIRDFTCIPIREVTLLYGPNSAGKSALADALIYLDDVLHTGGSFQFEKWFRREQQSPPELMVVGAAYDIAGGVERGLDFGPSSPLPFELIYDHDGDGWPWWWRQDSENELAIEIQTTRRRYQYVSRVQLTLNGDLVAECESDEGHEHTLTFYPAAFGDRFIELFSDAGLDAPQDLNAPIIFNVNVDAGPLRLLPELFDPAQDDPEQYRAIRQFVNHFLSMARKCARSSLPSRNGPDRGLIRDHELSVFERFGKDSNTGRLRSLDALETKTNINQGLAKVATSFLQETLQKEARDLEQVASRLQAKYGLSTTPFGPNGRLHEFVNRCLSDHLFLDQGYQLRADVHPLSTAGSVELGATEEWQAYVTAMYLVDRQGDTLTFEDVGTGLSCVVPVLIDLYEQFSFVQQPELHLHPALQSALGDVLVEGSQYRKKRQVVETHSEYLLLRCLRRIRDTFNDRPARQSLPLTPDKVAVLYFDPQPDGSTQIREIRLSARGDFLDRWPRGFFEERGKDLFDE